MLSDECEGLYCEGCPERECRCDCHLDQVYDAVSGWWPYGPPDDDTRTRDADWSIVEAF